ncbi:MAG: hypothetical protein RJA07_980 [Bacteroidota bacterium]|jgi:hypothetical protein
MKCIKLLQAAKQQMMALNKNATHQFTIKNFEEGAFWMYEILKIISPNSQPIFIKSKKYEWYGRLKYGLSMAAFFVCFFIFTKLNFLLIPISFIVFYIVEIHFAFLFPLLIDGAKNPIQQSVYAVYKIGFIAVLVTVIGIAAYMLIGLFNFKQPLKNWYIGCLAILTWYNNDVRNRI